MRTIRSLLSKRNNGGGVIQEDIEEIPFIDTEPPTKPERDFQPPRVNTFFDINSAETPTNATPSNNPTKASADTSNLHQSSTIKSSAKSTTQADDQPVGVAVKSSVTSSLTTK